ncbi:hypothetical protein [Desulfobacter sp.]|uniref:hypothetical protein n=1 Tax=Desulfobacter sp. TaxID=2294 RepID=UPI003D135330
MKTVWGWFITLLVAALFASCGTTKVDSIHPVVRTASFGEGKKIVILPFADYTPSDSPMEYWRRNVVIMESLQDEILRYGYMPVVNEDVISYLTDKKIINQEKMSRNSFPADSMLKAELERDWSDEMKVEIATILLSNGKKRKAEAVRDIASEYKTIALDAGTIRDIGQAFDADYIVRGRIMVFKTGREDSFNPFQTGVLPFFFNFGSRTAFGVADSENYEMIDKMAIGGLLGAAIAPSGWPIEESSGDTVLSDAHPRFDGGLSVTGGTSYTEWNTAIWGVAGAAVAHLAHKGGRVDNAVVQLRMIVQNTRTGGILWTNRSEVKTMSESIFSKKDADTLMSHAIQQVCERLVDSFAATENHRRIVRINDDGTFYVTPYGGLHKYPINNTGTIYVDSPAMTIKKRTQLDPVSRAKSTK